MRWRMRLRFGKPSTDCIRSGAISIWSSVRKLLFANIRYRLSAVGLATLIWGVSFLGGGTTVKDVIAPIEFANVPTGLYIANQPLNAVSVQLRGNSWVMNPAMAGLTAHVDLSGLGEGWHTIRLSSPGLRLPPGVSAERLAPETISLRLACATAHFDRFEPDVGSSLEIDVIFPTE